ncbi:MAG: hypothetical protein IJV67_00955 [Clostridia bacterium]|nr:hypothetical protein [Clostridia bacterium]
MRNTGFFEWYCKRSLQWYSAAPSGVASKARSGEWWGGGKIEMSIDG